MEFHLEQSIGRTLESIALSNDLADTSFYSEMRIADPRFGTFQANGILAYSKKIGQNPRALASQLLPLLQQSPLFNPGLISTEIAGPGFLNFSLHPRLILDWILFFDSSSKIQQAATNTFTFKNKRIIIDFSSPNTAKQMHVGHLRSMIIGDAIHRLLKFSGALVIRDNHLGDWGTQFGILIAAIKHFQYDLNLPHSDPIEDLESLYKQGSALFKEDTNFKELARQELIKLQTEEPENFALWQKITALSWSAFDEIYKIMDVSYDQIQGESFYRNQLDRVYKELSDLAISETSEGAQVVFHKDHKRFNTFPFMIRKADGTSNYASTDLATALHHTEVTKASTLLYVTDGRQQDHFQQLFLTVQKWFTAKGYSIPKMEHIWFGMVLGQDGKAIKTRSGDPIKLKDLISEAQNRAFKIVSEKNPSLPINQREEIARVVGIGALKYADLAQNRTSDYVFSWDKLLSFEGNTAPYLLYAIARIHSIFDKLKIDYTATLPFTSSLETNEELQLATHLIYFPSALDQSLHEYKPHFLCGYLFELAGKFSTFYSSNKVITEDQDTQNKRLTLCARTLMILELGLNLLGIQTLKKM